MSSKLEEFVGNNKLAVGYALVALALAVVVLVYMLWSAKKEGLTAARQGQVSGEQFEGYTAFPKEQYTGFGPNSGRENLDNPDAARAAAVHAALAGGENPGLSLGRLDLKNCKVSEISNADPWMWMYASMKGAPANAHDLENTKESMSNKSLAAIMQGH